MRIHITVPLHHLEGVSWHEATPPRRWHRCKTWTFGEIDFEFFERCACGSIRRNGRYWDFRNSRRKR